MRTSEKDVVEHQIFTQDRWTSFVSFSSQFRYPYAAPLRRLFKEFRRHNEKKRMNRRVLDFGFGHGHALLWFQPPSKIYGIELSSKAIKNIKKKTKYKGYKEFEFKKPLLSDSTKLEFPNNFFDTIIISHCLEHVYDDKKLLREFFRVMKRGALIYIIVPYDAKNNKMMTSDQNRRNPNFPEKSYHVWNYNVATLNYLADIAGFKIKSLFAFDAIKDYIRTVPRVIQIFFTLMLVLMPYSIWEFLDSFFQKIGYRCAQICLVAEK